MLTKDNAATSHAHCLSLNNIGTSAIKPIFPTLFLHNEINQRKFLDIFIRSLQG